MKKLMVMAAVAVCAAAVNAASVSWVSSAIYVPVPNPAEGKEGEYLKANNSARIVSASLWEFATEVAFSTYASMTAEELYAAKSSLGSATDSATSGSTGGITLKGTTDYKETDYAYGVVIYEFNDGEKDWFAAYAVKSDEKVGTGIKVNGILETTKTDVSEWHSVPEPTSGLLLLLGVAGLALRRRRA